MTSAEGFARSIGERLTGTRACLVLALILSGACRELTEGSTAFTSTSSSTGDTGDTDATDARPPSGGKSTGDGDPTQATETSGSASTGSDATGSHETSTTTAGESATGESSMQTVSSGDDVPLACFLPGGCGRPDEATCACEGCPVDNNETCEPDEDCVCADCAGFQMCGCNGNEICNPYREGCDCPDCAGHPECTG